MFYFSLKLTSNDFICIINLLFFFIFHCIRWTSFKNLYIHSVFSNLSERFFDYLAGIWNRTLKLLFYAKFTNQRTTVRNFLQFFAIFCNVFIQKKKHCNRRCNVFFLQFRGRNCKNCNSKMQCRTKRSHFRVAKRELQKKIPPQAGFCNSGFATLGDWERPF